MKVAVGMSGGVDSAVTAALLLREGHEVVGLTMKMSNSILEKGFYCANADSIRDAQQVADELGIKLHVVDISTQFEEQVISYLKKEYTAGFTPNPCVMCNRTVKFGAFLDEAARMNIEFDKIATGHYARITYNEKTKRYGLRKARFLKKDQTYFLSLLRQDQLARIIFPLGTMESKDKVREIAAGLRLPVHAKKESQDFLAGNYTEIFNTLEDKGDIVLASGQVVGEHRGIWNYTVGQRRGLGVSYHVPLYVIAIDTEHNRVIAGTENELYKKEMMLTGINWIEFDEKNLKGSIEAKTRIRYMHTEADSTIEVKNGGTARVVFDTPQRALTPGQFAVFYRDDCVLGGGRIQ